MRRRKSQPWFCDFPRRPRFEAAARRHVPDIDFRKVGKGWKAVIVYTANVDIPEYGKRRITIRLGNGLEPWLIGATADGPTDSPHRYGDTGHLCMWHPNAGPDGRWTPDEGLWALIQYVRLHLFREAHWRATGGHDDGIWAGDETPHGQSKSESPQSEAA